MSGIAGFYNLDGSPAEELLLRRMAAPMAHRGVDGIGHWIDGPIGFSHLMLRSTPESGNEKQPLTSRDATLCLTLDGRIDNRLELQQALASKGFPVRDDTDPEVILQSYACWGEDCPQRLLGDFGFALWDARKRQLFCARDHVGVRPFYYHRSPSLFAFGSEIRSLLALDVVPRRLNESRIVDFLVEELDREDEESTFYQDVIRLPAGHCLTVGPDRFALRDYWEFKPPPVLQLGSLPEYGEAFREVFLEAVRCRLRCAYPVGSTLSGGLDFSAVGCATRELLASGLKEPLHTISLVDADESKCGETPYIREVLRGGRVTSHIVRSDEVSPMTEQMSESDEPFEIAGYFSNWFGFAAAKKAGVRVLLDGISGDHITPPYSYLSTMVRSFELRAVLRELSFSSREYGEPRLPNLMRFGIGPIAPGLFVALRWLARGRGTAPYPSNSMIDHKFAARMGVLDRLELRRRTLWEAARSIDTLHFWSFTCGVLPGFFEQSGRMAAAMGIETRHPFSDRRVIEFFLSLPLEVKTYAPLPKRVIREGMKGILPELVRHRTKYAHPGQAFQSALLRQHVELLRPNEFAQTLGRLRPYVNLNAAESARNSVAIGSPEAGSAVWKLLNFALWLGSKNL